MQSESGDEGDTEAAVEEPQTGVRPQESACAYMGSGSPKDEQEALELLEGAARAYGIIAADTETISLKNRTCIGLGISCREHRVYVSVESPMFDRMMALLSNEHLLKVYHNSTFDLQVEDECADWRGIAAPDFYRIADTSTMAQVQGLPAKLADLTALLLGREIQEISDILPERATMLDVPFAITAQKCLDDIKATEDLFYRMGGPEWGDLNNPHDWQPVKDKQFGYFVDSPDNYHVSTRMKDCYAVDIRLIPLLHRLGRRGIALRYDRVKKWHSKLSVEKLQAEDVCSQVGFNPGSNQQVGLVLASRGNMLDFTPSRKQLKVDDVALKNCKDPLAAVILKHRSVSKLLGTYIEPCLGLERFFTHYRADLATGRTASFDRNVQNIPPEIREIFGPDNPMGLWTDQDASQIEMRMWAYQTGDPIMLEAYRLGENVHLITQAALWPGSTPKQEPIYTTSKTFNYAMIFDASAETLSDNTGIPVAECQRYKELWLAKYHVGASQMEVWRNEQCQWVESDFGRRMRLPDEAIVGEKHRNNCKLNYRPQGTAADVHKRCLLIGDAMGLPMAAIVHDEILHDGIVEVPEIWTKIHPAVETPFDSRVVADWY